MLIGHRKNQSSDTTYCNCSGVHLTSLPNEANGEFMIIVESYAVAVFM
jgi:hypothetical protein